MDMPPPTTQVIVNTSLRPSIKEGRANAVSLGGSESYFTAFAVFLKASPLQLAIISSLPTLIVGLGQLVGAKLAEVLKSRRRSLTVLMVLQGVVLLPMAILAGFGHRIDVAIYLVILLIAIHYLIKGLVLPIWNSLLGDLVPPEKRGRFFGYRSRVVGLMSFIALVIAGLILEINRNNGQAEFGFLTIFLLSAIACSVGAYWISKHADPPFDFQQKDYFSFLEFISRLKKSNFARFVLFMGLFTFAQYLSLPFFAKYLLDQLNITYGEYTFLAAISLIGQYLTLNRWGKLSDAYGNKKILTIASLGVSLTPFCWLMTSNFWFLAALHLFSGCVWAGYNLSAANFLFDAVTPPKRPRCVAYQGVVVGVFGLSGALVGSFVVAYTDGLFDWHPWLTVNSSILTVILLSGLCRLAVSVFVTRSFKEVRGVESVASKDLIFMVASIRPFAGAMFSYVGEKLAKAKR